MISFEGAMLLNFFLANSFPELIVKVILFVLLCFGSLLWPLAIIAVIWGLFDGFVPAINNKEYERAAAILAILLVTCAVIIASLHQAVFLTGFIIPLLLGYVYIRKYISTPKNNSFNDYLNN